MYKFDRNDDHSFGPSGSSGVNSLREAIAVTGTGMTLNLLCFLFISMSLALGAGPDGRAQSRDFRNWSEQEALKLLNQSPWAQRETFTRVVGGVGSGVQGEKEIFSTFYIRFLSARPIREAYARVQQIRYGYDHMSGQEREKFERWEQQMLEPDLSHWVIVAVTFRSNDPNEEFKFRQYYESQTLESLKKTNFLSTPRFGQVQPVAFYPAKEDGVGVRFVFPRTVDGQDIISAQDSQVTFELSPPVAAANLRSTFSPSKMKVNGQLVY